MKRSFFLIVFIITSFTVSGGKVSYNYQICGDSMKPILNNDNYCNIYKVETYTKNDAKIGDIVCFNYYKPDFSHSHYQYVCHELVHYDDVHFCTYSTYYDHYDRCMEWSNIALKVVL